MISLLNGSFSGAARFSIPKDPGSCASSHYFGGVKEEKTYSAEGKTLQRRPS